MFRLRKYISSAGRLLLYSGSALIVFTVVATSAFTQASIFEAEISYRKKEHAIAVKLYRQAMEHHFVDASVVLDALNCATSLGDTSAVLFFMERGYLVGLDGSDYRRLWPRFGHGLELDSFLEKTDSTSLKNQYKEALNQDIIERLEEMVLRDQFYRDSEEEDMEKQLELDRMNWATLRQLTEELGRLPTYAEMGLEGADNLELIFIHMDLEHLRHFLPHVIKGIRNEESTLAEIFLYQLDRIGMADGVIYTVNDELSIQKVGDRHVMKNGYQCQAFGEWLKERSIAENKLYAVPLDPNLNIEEVNRVRKLFGLDSYESLQQREPWVRYVSIEEFEKTLP